MKTQNLVSLTQLTLRCLKYIKGMFNPIVWELNLSRKQSLPSDTFVCNVKTAGVLKPCL